MPEYTLDEIEKAVPDPTRQILLFGDTVARMRKIEPNYKVRTWIEIDEVTRIFGNNG